MKAVEVLNHIGKGALETLSDNRDEWILRTVQRNIFPESLAVMLRDGPAIPNEAIEIRLGAQNFGQKEVVLHDLREHLPISHVPLEFNNSDGPGFINAEKIGFFIPVQLQIIANERCVKTEFIEMLARPFVEFEFR